MTETEIHEQGAYWLHLPDLGEGLAEATIIDWPVSEGEHVAEGQPLVTVETDKAVVEIPSPVTGILTQIAAPTGSTLAVGSRLARLDPA